MRTNYFDDLLPAVTHVTQQKVERVTIRPHREPRLNNDLAEPSRSSRVSRTKKGDAEHDGITLIDVSHNTATEPFNQTHMDAIKAGNAVSVWSGVLGEWLWWVRGETERDQLLARGYKQPIYTLGELALVVGMDRQELRNVHALKRDLGAEIKPLDS